MTGFLKRWAPRAALVVAIGVGVGLFITRSDQLAASDLPDHQPDLQNGQAVFIAGGCASCHADAQAKGEDKLILAGGQELHSDFGTFVVPNISPDLQTGIGDWTMAQFVSAMQLGTRPDGAHYYPAFPFGSYAKMDVRDVMDLRAYLDTLPVSQNDAGPNRLNFPFSIRRAAGVWKFLYLSPAPVLAEVNDAQLERGRYLVEGPGHCAECHTSRTLLGGLRHEAWLAGAPNPDGKGRIPNITPSDAGIGSWVVEDIAYYLESGFTPEFDSVGGSMVKVVENTSQMTPEDRLAIAAYLKAIPALPTAP